MPKTKEKPDSEKRDKEDIDSKEAKKSRVLGFISSMEGNQVDKFTPVSKILDLHPDSLRGIIDEIETEQKAGLIEVRRDKDSFGIDFKRLPDNLDEVEFRSQIRERFNDLDKKLDRILEFQKRTNKKLPINLKS